MLQVSRTRLVPSIENLQRRVFSSSTKYRASDQPIPLYVPIVGGLVITIAGGVKYLHDLFGGTEGLKRSVSFYSVALPKYAQYRYHQYLESPQHVWDNLDHDTAEMALDVMLELKGFYIKSGQICAANIGNAFPKIWIETLSVLQDQCPSKDIGVVRGIIESEYGKPLEEVFSSFEEEPIGAASIGQVHRATLQDGNNTRVVVKVMYPEVEQLFRGDVRTIRLFAQMAQPVHVPAIEEIEKQFMNEFDYEREAQQLNDVRENLIMAGLEGEGKLCRVPKPYLALARKRVLVMEELIGEKLQVELQQDLERNAKRIGKTSKELVADIEEKEAEAKARGEIFQGPSATEYKRHISMANTKRRMENTWSILHNVTIGWIPGIGYKEIQSKGELPINHAKLIDDLIYIHGHEVCVDGKFNGDAHPGNILLLGVPEGKPQLGLIDYGQVPVLSRETRLIFCKLIVAMADDNRADIISLMKEAGYKSKYMDEDNIYLYAKVGYDEDNAALTGGDHIQIFMEKLQSKDPIETLPRPLLMVSRCSTMLRGLAHAVHQSRSIAHAWKPIAEKVLREEAETSQ
jgi:aarF domain-containing kinase